MENNDKVCDVGGQNLIGYVNNVLMRNTKMYHLEHRLPLWDIKLLETYDNYCSR